MRNVVLASLGYLAILGLLLGTYFAWRKHVQLRNSDQFDGRVIGHVPKHIGGRQYYALKVEYLDFKGQRQEFVTTQTGKPASRNIREPVRVFVPKNGANPDVLVFELVYLKYFIGITLGTFALVCFLSPYILRAIYIK